MRARLIARQASPTRVMALLLATTAAWAPSLALATPVQQILSRSASTIAFGVESPSPALDMNGRLQDFSGAVSLNPTDNSLSHLQLTLNLNSAQLPADQFLQNVFLQSIISRFKQPTATFRGTSFAHIRDDEYTATGSYSWQNRTRAATVPFRLVRVSTTKSEIKVSFRGGLSDGPTPPEFSAIGPAASQSTGWARATLIFVPAPK